MDLTGLFSSLWGAAFIIIVVVIVLARRGRRRLGPGAAGAMYDWETRDKRRATELIVEHRAEARDPERAQGHLPDLETPARPGSRLEP